jgi:quercetin dioxygenase-like cupin family protein
MSNTETPISTGQARLTFRKTGTDTDGELLEMEARYPPNSSQPPYHFHPYQGERFEVLQGEFRTKIDGVERSYRAGEEFIVPVNTPHWMYNTSDEEGRLLWQVRPAMKTQAFLETMWGLGTDEETNTNGLPNILQLAVILREYSDEFRASSPPYPIQRILFAILAPIGRLLGYRARYARYSGDAKATGLQIPAQR